jgi:MATE family multidrug resistance protein
MHRPIAADIARLAWPIWISQIAILANGVIDTVMAGRYGTVDLAAVGIGTSVYVTLFVTLMGVLFAITPTVAQLQGAGRHAEIGEEVRQSAWLALGLAALSTAALTHPGPLLALSALAPDVEAKTRAYLDAIAWGVPAALLFRVFQGFSTAISRPRVVMALNLGALALKIPLNWVFMYGKLGLPELGGAGCAAATSTIAWLTCAAAWTWCRVERDYARYGVFARWSWPRWRAQWQLVSLGVPIGATFFVDVTAFTFMALFIARFGALYSGAHQIAANVAALAFMLPLAIGNAAAVLVGQALGAGDPRHARVTGMTALAVGVGCGVAVGAALFLLAAQLAGLYTGDPQVQRLAATLLGFVAAYHLFDAAQAVVVNALRGYRHAAVPMVIFGVALWGVGLGGGYAIGIAGIGVAAPLAASGFWLAAVVGMALAATLVTAYFLRVSRPGGYPSRARRGARRPASRARRRS